LVGHVDARLSADALDGAATFGQSSLLSPGVMQYHWVWPRLIAATRHTPSGGSPTPPGGPG
jgi:hypothetical protein